MGLHFNTNKTKAMIMFPDASKRRESREAYTRRFIDPCRRKDRGLQKVNCPQCNQRMNRQFLPLHQHEAHGFPLHISDCSYQDTSQLYHVDFSREVNSYSLSCSRLPIFWSHSNDSAIILLVYMI